MAIRILVVDDATFIRDMVKKHLREKITGAEVVDAGDGHRAIAQLRSQPVDLILSDWEMPGMNGEELLRWVRAHETFKNTPFIMVTSRGERDHVVKAVEAGVSDYMSKPFTPEELLKKTFKQLRKIGKAPTDPGASRSGATQGIAFASVDVLTGGRPPVEDDQPSPNTEVPAANIPPKKSRPAAAAKSKGRAQIRLPEARCVCVIRELSLQSLTGLIQRSENLPILFDPAVVDIEIDNENIARVNGYVHSLQAGEQRVDTNIIKIVIRFVDNDPEKFEILSQYIARF